MSLAPNVVCDHPHSRVRVVRFTRPDMREVLYDAEPIGECGLYHQIRDCGGLDLGPGQGLVLNFGLVEWFPSVFFRVLMEIRAEVARKRGHLVVCNFPVTVREAFDLMGGSKLFEVRGTESRAVHDASL